MHNIIMWIFAITLAVAGVSLMAWWHSPAGLVGCLFAVAVAIFRLTQVLADQRHRTRT